MPPILGLAMAVFIVMYGMGFVVVFASRVRFLRKVGHILIGVANLGQISGTGSGIQVSKHCVIARIVLKLAYVALRVRKIAECNTIRRADLLTSRNNRTVGHLQVFF